jgi:hypothetical protein
MTPAMGVAALHNRARRTRLAAAAVITVVAVASLVMIALPWTGATISNNVPANADLGAAHIFRGTRDTVAFSVTDNSSGSSTDGSNAYAFASDGRYYSSYAFGSSFSTSRYLELDLNSPLPAGLSVSSGQLSLRISGVAAGTSTCVYVEIRQASTGSLVSTHGSAGSPLGCSSGTTFSTITASLGAVSSTDIANNLRIRVYASDSSAGALRVDAATISGSTPYASFTLYPILTRDHHDGNDDLIRWGLAS